VLRERVKADVEISFFQQTWKVYIIKASGSIFPRFCEPKKFVPFSILLSATSGENVKIKSYVEITDRNFVDTEFGR